MRRLVFILASILVSAFFLWLALRDVPINDVVDSIRQAGIVWLGINLLCGFAGMVTRAIRWRGLVGFKIPAMQAFHMINITFILNQLPLRAGEVARSLLAAREGVPVFTAAATIVVERLLDTLLVVVMLSAALSRLPDAPALVTQSATLFGVVAVAGFIVLLAFARFPNIAHRFLDLVERILPFFKRLPFRRILDHVLDGLEPLTHWRGLSHAVFWTLVSWGISLGAFYSLHRALPIVKLDGLPMDGVELILSAALSLALASFSIAIPVSVAAIGPFEAAVKLAGQAVNMSAVWATSLGFLIHGMNVLSYAIWGVIGMLAMGVSLSDVMKAQDAAPAPGSQPTVQ